MTLPADTVIVNGNLSLSNQNVRGNALYGGTLTKPNTVNFSGGAPIQRPNALETANTQAYVTVVAAAWAALPSNGTTTFQYGRLRLNGTPAAQNVIRVNGSTLSSAPAGSTVIVNVSGASGRMTNTGISLGGLNRNRVVFNFYEATSLTISSASVPGLVWAPQAAVSLTNGNLTGSLVANMLTGGSANFTYDVYLGALPR